MIELESDELVFRFPDVHPEASLGISLQRTLRIPDDGAEYPLPPGLGHFTMEHVDDHAAGVPAAWIEHGGVMLPMYQSEAMWILFDPSHVDRRDCYPFAIRVAAGKIDAVTGEPWSEGLDFARQNYLVAPEQPWIDGFCVEEGLVRQFVAMPLGEGYSAEEQIVGRGETGGLQIEVRPMRREAFERHFPEKGEVRFSAMECLSPAPPPDMGLAPGGRIRQQLYPDPYDPSDWTTNVSSRCFVHIANSAQWKAITGKLPGRRSPDAKVYTEHGLPWFSDYDEGRAALPGAKRLRKLKSVGQVTPAGATRPVREGASFRPERVIDLRRKLVPGQVRESV